MKKLFITLVVALMCATMSFAQSTLVATLTHGDEITMFYGTWALRDAHNAAVSGDIINLSGGAFQISEITKAITLRGTGIDAQNPTYIITYFNIDIPTTDTGRLSMEGVRCTKTITIKGTLNKAYFLKCQFSTLSCSGSDVVIDNVMFANCKITDQCYMSASKNTMQFINSYVSAFSNNSGPSSSAIFVNCVILPGVSGMTPENIVNSQFANCIFYLTNGYYYYKSLSASSVATNCVAIGYTNMFNQSPSNTNCKTSGYEELFKDFTGTYTDDQTFELKDEAKSQFLGTDGTEVGMHGGVLPYDTTPSYPQITKMNVANKTTADGKLSVEIEVSAAE